MTITPRKRAALIIADNMDAGSTARIDLIRKYLEKIQASNKIEPMFSDVCLYFHLSEVATPSPIFGIAKAKGIGIIADTLNANFKQAKTQEIYIDHIQNLMALGVTMGRIDDANTLPPDDLQKMLVDIPGWRWILSSGVHDAPEMGRLASNLDADAKITVQTYLNGADIKYLQGWLRAIGMWSVDFECYKEGSRMTTPDEIKRMGDAVTVARKRNVMVYGHDANTNLLSTAYKAQWAALRAFLGKWWVTV